MHPQAYAYVAHWARRLGPRAFVLEVGSRNVNGSARDLFPGAEYLGIDIAPGPGVDVVADGAAFTPAVAPDLVVTTEVLEHSPQAEAIIQNAHRILSPGGMLILTTAWTGRAPHSAVDGGRLREGEWYANISAFDLVRWLRPFLDWQIATDGVARDIRAIARKGAL
ncbi:MAG: class I SAM-dependent methyltransferase [Dehalococcoidia bacterium]